jgi:hypothetical protein
MFPPGTPTDLTGSLSSDADDDHHIPEAIKWFRTLYPCLQRKQPKKKRFIVAEAAPVTVEQQQQQQQQEVSKYITPCHNNRAACLDHVSGSSN